tara:strand:+ start:14208 stop:14894 length:687 start_codon:yes stop_codon:yes gene_type:complete
MSKQTTNNVFGIARDLADGLNNSGIVTNVVDLNQGGENPAFAVRLYQRLSTTDGGVVVINSGRVGFSDLTDSSGGTISVILSNYLRDITDFFLQPFIDNDIGDTVNTNITGTKYLSTISNLSYFTPDEDTARQNWTDNELIASFALSSLGIVNRGLFLYLDNVNLQKQITTIADEIRNELQTQIVRETALVVDIETEAIIDMRYLLYVEKYGPPEGGVFDPVKLAEFI